MGIPKPWASDRLPPGPEIPTVTPPPATWGWGRDLGSVAVGLGTPTRPLPESDSSPGCTVPPQYVRPNLTLGSLPARTQYLWKGTHRRRRLPAPTWPGSSAGSPPPASPEPGRWTAPCAYPSGAAGGGSARQVRARHRAGCVHAPSPRGCLHSALGRQSRPVRPVSCVLSVPRDRLSPPRPTTHSHRSRGRRRNSARRAPRRGTKSGAG